VRLGDGHAVDPGGEMRLVMARFAFLLGEDDGEQLLGND
jgi:hypothetical protein